MRRWMRAGAVLAVAGVAAGCATAGAIGDDPTGAPSSATMDPVVVTGTGGTSFPGQPFAVPDGARSATIEFDCAGDQWFTVELGDAMALQQGSFSGPCGETQSFSWPIVDPPQSTLYVAVGDDVEWTASASFSSDEFASDEVLARECREFSGVLSALINADQGFSNYDAFDETEWASRVGDAVRLAETLAAGSTSEIASSLAEVYDVVSTPRTPGQAQQGFEQAQSDISRACNGNHTPVAIQAEFGG